MNAIHKADFGDLDAEYDLESPYMPREPSGNNLFDVIYSLRNYIVYEFLVIIRKEEESRRKQIW